jgi:hypothetical protein
MMIYYNTEIINTTASAIVINNNKKNYYDDDDNDDDDFEKPKEKKPKNASSSVTGQHSRYANSKAKKSLSSLFNSDQDQMKTMATAFDILTRSKALDFNNMNQNLATEFSSLLEKFVCWTCKNASFGISRSSSGGKYNTAIYWKVSHKNMKFQAHKLSLCHKMQIPYTKLENDTSHLCHNRLCWRPDHLQNESHDINKARNSGIGCAGWIFDSKNKSLCCLCKHEPRCMFVRVFEHIVWENHQ